MLIQQSDQGGPMDLVIEGQDFKSADGLETTIAVLLFTDARADDSEVTGAEKRRGWVGNILRSVELGGMLWLASQVRNTQHMQNFIKRWAEDSLKPLISDGFATGVLVAVIQDGVRGIKLNIEVTVKNGIVKKYPLWLDTNLGNLTNGN